MQLNAIDRAIAEMQRQADADRARNEADAPFVARASAIVEANSVRITRHGMSGAAQMFDHLFSAGVNKKLAAECLIASRRNRTRGGEGCRRAAARYLAEAASYRRAFVARAVA